MIFKGEFELNKIKPGDFVVLEAEDMGEDTYPKFIRIKIDKALYALLKESFSNKIICIASSRDKELTKEISKKYLKHYHCCIYKKDRNTNWDYYLCFVNPEKMKKSEKRWRE